MAERYFCPTIRAGTWPQAQAQLNNRLQLLTRMLNSISTGAGIPESRLSAALAEGWNAKIITFYQDDEPSAAESSLGDLWVDTNDTNKLYRYSGSAWVTIVDEDISQALANAATAQSTADGKVVTFVQTSPPTAEGVGDLWFDSDDDNKPYRWSGSTWVAAEFDVATWSKIIGVGKPEDGAEVNPADLAALDSAQDTKLNGVETGADVTGDHPGDIIYYSSSPPSHKVGRLWFDTNTNLLKRSTGSAWNTIGDETALKTAAFIASQGALATKDQVDTAEVVDGAVTPAKMTVAQLADIVSDLGTQVSGIIESGVRVDASWRKIYDNIISSPATAVTLSGLDGDTDIEYRIRCRWVAGAITEWGLRFNNDGGNNYGNQFVWGNGSSAAAQRNTSDNYQWWGETDTSGKLSHVEGYFYAKSGKVRTTICFASREVSGTTILYAFYGHGVWSNTASNLVSIVFRATAADGIGIGSHIEVWQRVA